MTDRRRFQAQLGAAAAAGVGAGTDAEAMALDAAELRAAPAPGDDDTWDTSWIDRLAEARHRVVFNASEIADGAALHYAATFLDHFRQVHGTTDGDTRPVIVFRRLGTSMAFDDALWDRYAIGAERKITDRSTGAPARRNVFRSAAPGASSSAPTLDGLRERGLISLVCNVSLGSWASQIAEKDGRAVEEVRKEIGAHLIPGAIVVPSGIYALIRAQNAGCAYMPGT